MTQRTMRFPKQPALKLLAFAALALPPLEFPVAAQNAPAAGIRLEKILDGEAIGRATGLVDPLDGTDRLFIVQQAGQIAVLENGVLLPRLFLDLSKKITCCENERGLLGLAFHPDYENNGFFYVVYSDKQSRTVVARFSVSSDPNVGDRSSEERIIRWNQPDLPHNGGAIAFGPDGHLYLGAGDGGTRETAQDLESLLGSILRIDVDSAFPYAIPEDNPFVGDPNARDEIWVYGLRNPWRFSIDHRTGDLFIGDVGAAQYEEINYQLGSSAGGENFGWPIKEGPRCILSEDACADESLVAPIISYPHKAGTCNSVTGGYRYRGAKVPTLPRFYIFADFCRGDMWGARRNEAGAWVVNELLQSGLLITTFAEDSKGNLFFVHFRGDVYRVVGQYLFASDFESGDTLGWSQRHGGISVAPEGLKRSSAALEVEAGRGKSFVRSKQPSAEKTFRLAFDLNVNRVNLANGAAEILRLTGSGKKGHVRLTLEQTGEAYFLNLLTRQDTGGFTQSGRTVVPRSRTVRIDIDWMAASAAGANDGQIEVFKNGKRRIFTADLDTDRQKVSSVTLGFPAGSSGAGTILIDNYVSTP
ncbi:MAG: PQQ-dependent sugar dehydrogenase [bacterium]|nr:PQQ-dependent sugar dehydrogenase [bacterium]